MGFGAQTVDLEAGAGPGDASQFLIDMNAPLADRCSAPGMGTELIYQQYLLKAGSILEFLNPI